MMKICFKKLDVAAKQPTRGSVAAAGYDLYGSNTKELDIPAHSTKMIGTGIAIEIPDGYFGGIYARSGLAAKKGLRPANCVGVIDSDYRGELKVALHNDTDETMTIMPQERIAQLIIQPYENVDFEEVAELTDSERGVGGFGSTGSN